MCVKGEARSALKWADGKVIKNEVDMQVCWKKKLILISVFVVEYSGLVVGFTHFML